MGTRRLVASALCLAASAVSHGASADEERSDARAAYDDAARAYEARDFLHAAEGFARADSLAPNALALKLALAAAIQADAPVLAEELALRAEGRDTSPDVQELARSGHRLAKDRVGKVEIACSSCVASVAGRELRDGQRAVVLRGPTVVTFTSRDGQTSTTTVDVVPNVTTRAVERTLLPSPPAVDVAPAPRRGLSPVVFWIGAGVTAALGGVTIASGLDANAQYDTFERARTRDTRDEGQAAELRTNVLLGGTVLAALVTGAIGLWGTRWTSPRDVALR